MWAEVGEIVLWVVLAGVVGLVAGWLLRSLGGGERRGDAERRLARARDEMTAARDEARREVERVSGLEDEIAGLRGRAEMQASLLAQRDQRIAELLADLDELAVEAERRGPERTVVAPPPPPPLPPEPEPEPEPADAGPAASTAADEPPMPDLEPEVAPMPAEALDEPGLPATVEPVPAVDEQPTTGPEAPRPIREPALQQPTLPGVLGPASAAAAAAAERRQESRRRNEPIVPLEDEDDLTRIRGVGPVLEGKLKLLGVRTYRQIAAWSARDVEDVSKALGSFPQRIERDGWIESAREQHRRKYGVHP
ncbi:MAG: hypothetical protein R3C15_09315 [Thermoleophilia bacterium]